jgi:hypothetical protein
VSMAAALGYMAAAATAAIIYPRAAAAAIPTEGK